MELLVSLVTTIGGLGEVGVVVGVASLVELYIPSLVVVEIVTNDSGGGRVELPGAVVSTVIFSSLSPSSQ